jgi:hypothetical protein
MLFTPSAYEPLTPSGTRNVPGQESLDQVEPGDGRYSLWTGDIGAAVFAADCLDAKSRYPVLG